MDGGPWVVSEALTLHAKLKEVPQTLKDQENILMRLKKITINAIKSRINKILEVQIKTGSEAGPC